MLLWCGEISLWRKPVLSDNTHSTSHEGQGPFFPLTILSLRFLHFDFENLVWAFHYLVLGDIST